MQNLWTDSPLGMQILESHTLITNSGKNIVFCWLPSHVGISGNEAADRAAKAALDSANYVAQIPAMDWKPNILNVCKNIFHKNWEDIFHNKLKEIVPHLDEHYQIMCSSRRDEVVLTRLRLCHSFLTHSFILKGECAPQCIGCNSAFTVKHILLHCIDFHETRVKYFTCTNLHELFHNVGMEKILAFIKEINLYKSI
jgi:hypothetical protein